MTHLDGIHDDPALHSRDADILVVDDNPNNIEVLTAMLTDLGFRCRVATNGRRAMAAVQTQLPDLIMLDIMMPDVSGYEVCVDLKQDPHTAQVPIICAPRACSTVRSNVRSRT